MKLERRTTVAALFALLLVGPLVARAHAQTPEPVYSWLFLLDCSGSMGQAGRLDKAKEAIDSYASQLRGLGGEWAVLPFCNHNCWVLVEFTTDDDLTEKAVSPLAPGGDTPLAWAVAQGIAHQLVFSNAPRGRVLLLSDGQEECPERSKGGGAKAVAAINRILAAIAGRAALPAEKRFARIGDVPLMPALGLGLGLWPLGQTISGQILGEEGQTVDDAVANLEQVAATHKKPIQVDVVGLGIEPGSVGEQQLQSIAQAGRGRYVPSADPEGLKAAFEQVIGPTLSPLIVCREVVDGTPKGAAESFAQIDKVWGFLSFKGMPQNSQATVVWKREGKEIQRSNLTIGGDGQCWFWVNTTRAGGFEPGGYEITVTVGDKPIGSKRFRVGG